MKTINDKSFKEAINRVAATDDGQIILAWMKNACNWDSTMMANDLNMTQHYASIRGVWGRFRQFIDGKYLKEIEHDIIVKNEVQTKKKAGK